MPTAASGPIQVGLVRPIRHRSVEHELLSDFSIVLFHAERRQVVTLNPTGALVWACCDGEHDFDAIVADVRELFPSAPCIDRDVREFLESLLGAGMIAPGAPPSPPPE